jgi:predicted ATPase with chaperone activity
MKFHEICGNEHAKRATEVALAGDHKIAYIGPPDGDAQVFSVLMAQAHTDVSDLRDTRLGYDWQPCPCGHYGHESYECTCSDQTIARWLYRHPFPQVDIYVSVCRPSSERLMRWARAGFTDGELHGQIMTRVKQARLNGLEGPFEFSDVAWTLLDAATKQLVLHTSHLRSTVAVAKTIARLANANQVEAAHMAEAIQYRPRSYDFHPNIDN